MTQFHDINRYFIGAILLLFFCTSFAQENSQTRYTFLSGNYIENGLSINYSSVASFEKINSSNKRKSFKVKLLDFLIEDANLNNETYSENQLTGVSFPINTAVNLLVDIQILYGSQLFTKQVSLSSIEKNSVTFYSDKNVSIDEIKFKISKTKEVKKLISSEVFINEIKELILNQNKQLTTSEKEKEYNRLMILGNKYLNQNNYNQAVSAYLKAKEYTNEEKPNTQIQTAVKYAKNNETTIDLAEFNDSIKEGSSTSTINKNNSFSEPGPIKTDKLKNNKIRTEVVDGIEYEYEYEYEYEKKPSQNSNLTTNNSNQVEYEYEYENSSEYTQVASIDNSVEYEYEYVDENGNTKTEVKQEKNPSINANKTSNSYITSSLSSSIERKSEVKKLEPIKTKTNNVLFKEEGFIKYRRDEQAVVNADGKTLIPYGKYTILRYRPGFAKVKIKDDIKVKNIVCTGKNEEYVWSARIYENPWIETVVDKNGNYVDELHKKVEIYIVDNVNYRPKEELSKKLINSYKDPNPFNGLTQISAHNLWNREHSKDPDVIKRREEIERLKKLSKKEAFDGANKCRTEVSPNFDSVVKYYSSLGYQIILRN